MAYRLTWSPEAVEDLESIAEYLERDSSFYAKSVVSKILEVSRNIKEFPLIGRVVPELGDENIRERFIYSYRPVYQIKEQKVFIVAVIHGKRLLETLAKGLKFKLVYNHCRWGKTCAAELNVRPPAGTT